MFNLLFLSQVETVLEYIPSLNEKYLETLVNLTKCCLFHVKEFRNNIVK